ncbi:MAG: ABC transporter permease subunit [Alphaproteobacteria bacterium]|nr:ABC transporter permease subunit [Alphaproteobacteria bacterium]
MFPDFGRYVQNFINENVNYIIFNFGDSFEAAANFLLIFLVGLERGLQAIPPWAIICLVGLLAYTAGRRITMALLLMSLMFLIGALGLWDQAIQTVAIILIAIMISVIIGLPTGILIARSSFFYTVITPFLDLMQTIPSFVYLLPVAMLFGLGKVPAILATVIYSTPPLVRLTSLGIRSVNAEIIEVARAFGSTPSQILRKVEIPLALPLIMQGLNQTIMMALSMVVVASMIGARGVGEIILLGLQRNDPGQGFLGGIVIVILAIIFDRISQSFGIRMQDYKRTSS